jgi:excisionase family DNA binding protein
MSREICRPRRRYRLESNDKECDNSVELARQGAGLLEECGLPQTSWLFNLLVVCPRQRMRSRCLSAQMFPGRRAPQTCTSSSNEIGTSLNSSPPTDQQPQVEPFVDGDEIAVFLSVTRRQALEWARSGEIPAHPLGRGQRRIWRFRRSEVAAAVTNTLATQDTIPTGSPRLAGKRKHADG